MFQCQLHFYLFIFRISFPSFVLISFSSLLFICNCELYLFIYVYRFFLRNGTDFFFPSIFLLFHSLLFSLLSVFSLPIFLSVLFCSQKSTHIHTHTIRTFIYYSILVLFNVEYLCHWTNLIKSIALFYFCRLLQFVFRLLLNCMSSHTFERVETRALTLNWIGLYARMNTSIGHFYNGWYRHRYVEYKSETRISRFYLRFWSVFISVFFFMSLLLIRCLSTVTFDWLMFAMKYISL